MGSWLKIHKMNSLVLLVPSLTCWRGGRLSSHPPSSWGSVVEETFSADATSQAKTKVGEEGEKREWKEGRQEEGKKGSKREVRKQREERSPALECAYPARGENGSATDPTIPFLSPCSWEESRFLPLRALNSAPAKKSIWKVKLRLRSKHPSKGPGGQNNQDLN